jgi:hypothetical protein
MGPLALTDSGTNVLHPTAAAPGSRYPTTARTTGVAVKPFCAWTRVPRNCAKNQRHEYGLTTLQSQRIARSGRRVACQDRLCVGLQGDSRPWRSAALTADVVLELLNDEFLLGDNVFDQVTDRNEPDELTLLEDGKVPQPVFRH